MLSERLGKLQILRLHKYLKSSTSTLIELKLTAVLKMNMYNELSCFNSLRVNLFSTNSQSGRNYF